MAAAPRPPARGREARRRPRAALARIADRFLEGFEEASRAHEIDDWDLQGRLRVLEQQLRDQGDEDRATAVAIVRASERDKAQAQASLN